MSKLQNFLRSPISLYGAVLFYFVAGVNHFVMPDFYYQLMPDFLSPKSFYNISSGFAEIVLAIALLWPQSRVWAARCICLLLLSFYLVHVPHLFAPPLEIPYGVFVFRIFLQVFFIYWAWQLQYIKQQASS
jgi:uncharacterized membrane protein